MKTVYEKENPWANDTMRDPSPQSSPRGRGEADADAYQFGMGLAQFVHAAMAGRWRSP